MPNSEPTSQEPAQKQQSGTPTGTQPEEFLSSPGNNSLSVTPKDVSPHDASAKDVTARKTCSDDPDEREQEMLDDAVDMTFPASDPIAIPTSESQRRKQQAEQR
jgi:hypothetical protein